MAAPVDVLQGTLDLLILKTLTLQPLHGWGISKRVRQLSSDQLQVNQGSLYPALYRLEDKGWIKSEWDDSREGRPVKVYELTAKGKRAFADEQSSWRTFAAAVEQVLQAT
jgi:transcriptional regulator